jgi:hypothetical protein
MNHMNRYSLPHLPTARGVFVQPLDKADILSTEKLIVNRKNKDIRFSAYYSLFECYIEKERRCQ